MKKQYGSISAMILCSSAILSKYLIVVPEYVVKHTGNSAWIVIACKVLISFASFLFTAWLYKPFYPSSLSDVFHSAFGIYGKVLLNYVYVISFIVLNSMLLRLLIEALNTVMAPDAPDEYFAFFILAAVFAGAFYGIRATSNLSIIIFPFVILSLIFICGILFPHYRLDNLMPILGKGTGRIISATFKKHFGFTEILLLFFYADFFGSYKSIRRSGLIALSVVGILTTLFTFSYCLTVPSPASESFFLPLYQMTRMIKASSFLQRLEPVSVFIWTSFILCSLSALISLCSRLLTDDRKKEKAFVPILIFITFFIAMIPKNEITAYDVYEKMLDYVTILFPTLPAVVLITARVRRRNKQAA